VSRPVDRLFFPETLGFRYSREEALIRDRCLRCGRDVERGMLADLDRREYDISALCPRCFDLVAESWTDPGFPPLGDPDDA
jgi:hypothetical protein